MIYLKVYENECVDCKGMGLDCIGEACPNRNVPHYYCDKCKDGFTPKSLYIYEGDEQLCANCLLEKFETVAQKEEKEW